MKLHGSTSWYKDAQGNIKRISEATPQIGQSRALLIYPTQVKANAVQEEPFKTAYEYFGASLGRTKNCVIIGFSFRDPAINKIFSTALAKNNELKLIIIDQAINNVYLESLREKLLLDVDKFNSKVHYFEKDFGEPEVISFIKKELLIA